MPRQERRRVDSSVPTPSDSTLSARHELVAFLMAAGYRNTEIARVAGIGANRISIISKSPLFALRLREIRREFVSGTLQSVLRRIASESDASVSTLIELRDTADEASVRRLAARDLLFDGFLDRVMPRKQDTETERTIRITFDGPRLDRMRDALAEDEATDVDFEEVPAIEDRRPSMTPTSIADFCAELDAASSDD